MAISRNANALYLARGFTPDVDLILENGLAAFGIKGSGKSNLVALMAEQLSRFLIPQIILDTENEYHTLLPALPHGVLADRNGIPSAYDILHKGLQVVVNLHSWEDSTSAALAICDLVQSLFEVARSQSPLDRVPCAIHLDEAGYWLPQKAVSYFSKETRKDLLDAFNLLGSRGRKYGLTPFLYTQFISQIDKDVIRQCGLRALMRQTQDNDIKRYGEYVRLTDDMRNLISSFAPGQAIIHGLPDGSRPIIRFSEQVTEHVSHTPKARAAIARFANTDIDFDGLQLVSYAEKKTPAKPVKPEVKDRYTLPEACALLETSRASFYIYAGKAQVKPCNTGHKPVLYTASDVEKCKAAMVNLV